MFKRFNPRTAPLRLALTSAVAGVLLTACAPLVIGGAAVGSAFVATDRRTSGTQLEDQGIELRVAAQLRQALGDSAHVNVNAFNRVVLLTGEVASVADVALAGRVAKQAENVQHVVNELAVLPASSLSSRSSDLYLQAKVKANLFDAKDVMSSASTVVVERGQVFLMGMVTEREAARMAEVASGVSGVLKVVKVFQLISEEELARKVSRPAAASAPEASSQR